MFLNKLEDDDDDDTRRRSSTIITMTSSSAGPEFFWKRTRKNSVGVNEIINRLTDGLQ